MKDVNVVIQIVSIFKKFEKIYFQKAQCIFLSGIYPRKAGLNDE